MKKIILTLIAIVSLVSVTAQSTWKVDGSHSSITFSVSHFAISEVTGNFGSFEIEAEANEKFENPTFNVSIDVVSINTNNERRDNHLRSDDFFGAEGNPKITFISKSYKQLSDGEFETTGDLTVHGITKEFTFKGKLNGVIKNPRNEKFKSGIKLTGTIKRGDFSVGGANPAVGDDVNVTINIEMNQQ